MNGPNKQIAPPPQLAIQWLETFVPQQFSEALIGDLTEEYFNLMNLNGKTIKADLWFYKQTLKTCFYFWLRNRENNMALLIGNIVTVLY